MVIVLSIAFLLDIDNPPCIEAQLQTIICGDGKEVAPPRIVIPLDMTRNFAGMLAVLILACTGCGGREEPSLLVFAATSLKNALTEVSEEYERRASVEVDISFGGSQEMAQQIVAGAPADVFISAGPAPLAYLLERKLVEEGNSRPILSNELVVVTTDRWPVVDSLDFLLYSDVARVALADPRLAPAGAYAEEALKQIELFEPLKHKILYGKDVRAAMSYVSSGNADAAIVYRTDASASSLRVVYLIPTKLHSPIVYPAAVLRGADDHDEAVEFLDFLRGPEAGAVFQRFGFLEPG